MIKKIAENVFFVATKEDFYKELDKYAKEDIENWNDIMGNIYQWNEVEDISFSIQDWVDFNPFPCVVEFHYDGEEGEFYPHYYKKDDYININTERKEYVLKELLELEEIEKKLNEIEG